MPDIGRIRSDRVGALIAGVLALTLPGRLHWSRRSGRLLTGIGLALIAGTAGQLIPKPTHTTSRELFDKYLGMIAGAILVSAQFQLSEEESAVRGLIAGLGAMLMSIGLLGTRFSHEAGDRDMTK
jgi:hypothetical protein